jgi:ParB-like chromosome segregation protein Spo0J
MVALGYQAANLLIPSGVDMARYLFIVSKTRPDLADYLVRHFSDEQDVLVTLDRRQGERRSRWADLEHERRQGHRRWRPENDEALVSVGAFMVPLDAPEPVA